MLGKRNRKYIGRQKQLIRGGWLSERDKGKDKGKDSKIRNMAKRDIKDLAYLAESLPEKQLKQIFNTETLMPLLKSVLSAETERTRIDEREQKKLDERKARILKLWSQILSHFGNLSYARTLVDPKIVQAVSMAEVPDTIKAIYFASVYGE